MERIGVAVTAAALLLAAAARADGPAAGRLTAPETSGAGIVVPENPAWSDLPFQWALTVKRGAGRREIAIFSDPNCPFCRRFERELAELDDLTVHVFMYPVIRHESARQAKAVWCSPDRIKAWNDLVRRRIEPDAKPDCETPIEELAGLGRRLGARSTPTWFLRSGARYSGAMKAADIEPLLDATRAK